MRENRDLPLFLKLPLLVAGAAIGLKFADVDQRLFFLTHRSILTHGLLASLLLLSLIRKQRVPRETGLRLFTIGFNLANSVHLCFDLFPKGWYRHALIHIPFVGWLPPLVSIAWILISILTCLYITTLLVRNMPEFLLSTAALLVTFWFAAHAERHLALFALLTLIAAIVVVLALAGRFVKTGRVAPNPPR